jgi:cytochrome c2
MLPILLVSGPVMSDPTPIAAGQSHFLESCGGCHGIEGISSPRDIPELRGAVGRFLCSRAGREYIVRLPNVAFAAVDDQTLAELLNFMMFSLGGASTPADARPYTKSEVAGLRRKALKSQSLEKLRIAVLMDAASRCSSNHAH